MSWILDSTPCIPDSRSLSVEFGFWIPIISEIPDSLDCIPDFKSQDSGSASKIFSVSRIPLLGRNFGIIVTFGETHCFAGEVRSSHDDAVVS